MSQDRDAILKFAVKGHILTVPDTQHLYKETLRHIPQARNWNKIEKDSGFGVMFWTFVEHIKGCEGCNPHL